MTPPHCEYCGQEERYGHNTMCVMNTVEDQRAEITRLRSAEAHDLRCKKSLRAEIARLRAALELSQSQNYCTLCGALEPKPKAPQLASSEKCNCPNPGYGYMPGDFSHCSNKTHTWTVEWCINCRKAISIFNILAK